MVSIWLTMVKSRCESGCKKNRPPHWEADRIGYARFEQQRLIGDTAGCGWCAGLRDRAGRSRTARKEIRRPSACSGCKPLRGKEGRRGLRQRLRLYGG